MEKQPLINVLIRTHQGREQLYDRAVKSVVDQTYTNFRIHTYHDRSVTKFPFHYNLFCNELKAGVTEGYFGFLDSDDFLDSPTALEQLAKHLVEDKAVICQMRRGRIVKPSIEAHIKKDYIGLPCCWVHHSHKDVGDVTAKNSGDWDWIESVIKKIGYKFVPLVVVNTPQRNYGR